MTAKPILLLSALSAAGAALASSEHYDQLDLVSDQPGMAVHTDPNLVNAWGLSHSAGSPWWISDNGTGVSTLYNGSGVRVPLVVSIPDTSSPNGAVSGQVFNGNKSAFIVSANGKSGASSFLFATEDGTVSGWAPSVDVTSAHFLLNNHASGDSYKGLALDAASSQLYVPNFAASTSTDQIKVYNGAMSLINSFGDATVDPGFKPFNATVLGGSLYVSYALRGPNGDDIGGAGNGFVDRFSLDGSSMTRLVSHGDLDSPWGMALAPSNFGEYSGDLLVGNFGDGEIHAFNALTGVEAGTLTDGSGNPLVIDGLWGLAFGNGGSAGKTNSLYFTAGPGGEDHGLFGRIDSVPGPAPASAMLLGGFGSFLRRRRKARRA